jgi:hypothetical protein
MDLTQRYWMTVGDNLRSPNHLFLIIWSAPGQILEIAVQEIVDSVVIHGSQGTFFSPFRMGKPIESTFERKHCYSKKCHNLND